jgi:hypothetical protein
VDLSAGHDSRHSAAKQPQREADGDRERRNAMSINEGTLDRVVRVVLGLVLVSLAIVGPQTPLAWVGIVPLVTGAVGFCPIYRVIGLRTTKQA